MRRVRMIFFRASNYYNFACKVETRDVQAHSIAIFEESTHLVYVQCGTRLPIWMAEKRVVKLVVSVVVVTTTVKVAQKTGTGRWSFVKVNNFPCRAVQQQKRGP